MEVNNTPIINYEATTIGELGIIPRDEIRNLYKTEGYITWEELCEIIAKDKLYTGDLTPVEFCKELGVMGFDITSGKMTRDQFIGEAVGAYQSLIVYATGVSLTNEDISNIHDEIPDIWDIDPYFTAIVAKASGGIQCLNI